MYDVIKETNCTHCAHKEVCKHKLDFLDVYNEILNCKVARKIGDNNSLIPVKNFDFLAGIIIKCKYYKEDNNQKLNCALNLI